MLERGFDLPGSACAAANLALLAANGCLPIGRDQPFHFLYERRKRFFRVCTDREVNFLVTPQVLIIASAEEVNRIDTDHLLCPLSSRGELPGSPPSLFPSVYGAPKRNGFSSERITPASASEIARFPCRNGCAATGNSSAGCAVDHARLQQLRQLHHVLQSRFGACGTLRQGSPG